MWFFKRKNKSKLNNVEIEEETNTIDKAKYVKDLEEALKEYEFNLLGELEVDDSSDLSVEGEFSIDDSATLIKDIKNLFKLSFRIEADMEEAYLYITFACKEKDATANEDILDEMLNGTIFEGNVNIDFDYEEDELDGITTFVCNFENSDIKADCPEEVLKWFKLILTDKTISNKFNKLKGLS